MMSPPRPMLHHQCQPSSLLLPPSPHVLPLVVVQAAADRVVRATASALAIIVATVASRSSGTPLALTPEALVHPVRWHRSSTPRPTWSNSGHTRLFPAAHRGRLIALHQLPSPPYHSCSSTDAAVLNTLSTGVWHRRSSRVWLRGCPTQPLLHPIGAAALDSDAGWILGCVVSRQQLQHHVVDPTSIDRVVR